MTDDDLYLVVGEPIAVLRQRFLIFCEGNECAAFLLLVPDELGMREAIARVQSYLQKMEDGQ